MLHSLSAQVSYYSNHIQNHSGWIYCGVYADEAKTGTKDSRENFQRLLTDCRAGKIDLVITKSISRFARNTVTLAEIQSKIKEFLDEMEVVSELVKKLINENAANPMNQDDYIAKYDGYTNRFNSAKAEYEKLQKSIEQRQLKADVISGFMFEVSELDDLPIEFDEKLWNSVVDTVTIYKDERLVFKFKNGTEIEEQL